MPWDAIRAWVSNADDGSGWFVLAFLAICVVGWFISQST